MPSRTIPLTEAPEPAPFAYTVGGTEGLTPEAVFASWDGSGAFGDFLPCVSYYDRDGNLLDRAFPDGVTLHPGDTAEVSYRPFKRGGGGGTSLETTDGGTVVNPTTELFIGSGLSLIDAGGGEAVIQAVPTAQPYLFVPLGGVDPYTPGDRIPFGSWLTPPAASGITLNADNFVLTQAGLYWFAWVIRVGVEGPSAGTQLIVAEMKQMRSGTPQVFAPQSDWLFTVTLGVGDDWSVSGSVAFLRRVLPSHATGIGFPCVNEQTFLDAGGTAGGGHWFIRGGSLTVLRVGN